MTAKEARKFFAHFRTLDHAAKFVSPEEFYQAVKARLLDELAIDTHGTSHYGVLVERSTAAVIRQPEEKP